MKPARDPDFDGKLKRLFERARARASCRELMGLPAGARYARVKVCPFCDGRMTLSVSDAGFKCWRGSCDAQGDAVALVAQRQGVSRFEAAKFILGAEADDILGDDATRALPAPRAPAPIVKRAPPPRERDDVDDVIADVRQQMRRAPGTLVETYLAARAIVGPLAQAALARLWFAPHAPYDVGALYGRGRRFPAMVAEIVTADGHTLSPTGGLHLTYLRADGGGKISLDPAKKMWGAQRDKHGRYGGVLLLRPREDGLLVVAEGLENAMSIAVAARSPGVGAFAAGSLDRLQGGMAVNAWHKTDWRDPRPDPEKPAATLPHRGPVLIGVDSDMSPLILNRDTQWERVIAPARRAAVSGLLAAHWWRRAGARDVRALTPPAGADANDVLLEGA